MLNLYRHLHPHGPQLDRATAERIWTTLLTSSLVTVIVAQVRERLLSSCTLAIVPNLSRGGRPYGLIENVVTHADHRRLGFGRRVVAHALDLAWRADCYKVHLATGSKQEATLRFWERAFIAAARPISKCGVLSGSLRQRAMELSGRSNAMSVDQVQAC